MRARASTVAHTAKDTHDPQVCWSLTAEIQLPPLLRQSTPLGALNGAVSGLWRAVSTAWIAARFAARRSSRICRPSRARLLSWLSAERGADPVSGFEPGSPASGFFPGASLVLRG